MVAPLGLGARDRAPRKATVLLLHHGEGRSRFRCLGSGEGCGPWMVFGGAYRRTDAETAASVHAESEHFDLFPVIETVDR